MEALTCLTGSPVCQHQLTHCVIRPQCRADRDGKGKPTGRVRVCARVREIHGREGPGPRRARTGCVRVCESWEGPGPRRARTVFVSESRARTGCVCVSRARTGCVRETRARTVRVCVSHGRDLGLVWPGHPVRSEGEAALQRRHVLPPPPPPPRTHTRMHARAHTRTAPTPRPVTLEPARERCWSTRLLQTRACGRHARFRLLTPAPPPRRRDGRASATRRRAGTRPAPSVEEAQRRQGPRGPRGAAVVSLRQARPLCATGILRSEYAEHALVCTHA